MNPLQKFIDQASGPVLVLHDEHTHALGARMSGVETVAVGDALPERDGRWGAIVLLCADAAALRRVAPTLPDLRRTRATACLLAEAFQPALLEPRPEWPPANHLHGRRLTTGECLTSIRWSRPTPANAVFEELARCAGTTRPAGHSGVIVARQVGAVDAEVPPDVVLGETEVSTPLYDVTGRAPTFVTEHELLAGPVDEGILNPQGFLPLADQPVVDLADLGINTGRGATASIVANLRDRLGVRSTWTWATPAVVARTLAGFAASGVPLMTEGAPPPDVTRRLGSQLLAALETQADLDDPLRREEHSIRLRRAALREHSTFAWRADLAERARIHPVSFPSITVVLATKRAHQLDFALRQVARQRSVTAELVLASHGFEPDPVRVRDLIGSLPVTMRTVPAETIFGDVLANATNAASGDVVVKMDDDDWYGPDFLADLLFARHYSGADLVGTAPEFVYLEEADRTIRRNDLSERYTGYVAGGTMMIDRLALRELGSFRPVHRFVDAQLRRAVQAAGLSTYRTHGLGYILRRTSGGHTWSVADSTFLDPDRVVQQWSGFAPSVLLEHDASDTPGRPPGTMST